MRLFSKKNSAKAYHNKKVYYLLHWFLGVSVHRIIYLILLMTMFLSAGAFAQRSNDFAGIPFGTFREGVIEEVMKIGYEPYGQRGAGNHIVIPVYNFGELPVQVDFVFNRNEKFYSFEIRTGRVERARLSKVFEAAAYMADQFTLKYGKSSAAPTIDENSTLKEGYENLFQRWYVGKTLDASIYIVQKGGRYFVLGTVVHRQLATEKKNNGSDGSKNTAIERPVF